MIILICNKKIKLVIINNNNKLKDLGNFRYAFYYEFSYFR